MIANGINSGAYAPGQHPDLPPPSLEVGVIGWLRYNLFSSPLNAVLTVLALGLVYILVPPLVQWALIDADWIGETREACSGEGACWVFIKVWFWQLVFGLYTPDERWRVVLAFAILIAAAIPSATFRPTRGTASNRRRDAARISVASPTCSSNSWRTRGPIPGTSCSRNRSSSVASFSAEQFTIRCSPLRGLRVEHRSNRILPTRPVAGYDPLRNPS